MALQSDSSCTVPHCSLPTFLFGSPHTELSSKPIIRSAKDPEGRQQLSLESYRLLAQRFATGLQKTGFEKGNRIALVSENAVAFPVVFMGSVMAGGVFSAFSPTSPASFLGAQLKDLEPHAILASAEAIDLAKTASDEAGLEQTPIFFFDDKMLFDSAAAPQLGSNAIKVWTELLSSEDDGAALDWAQFCDEDSPDEQLAAINYTSGTTGVSKGCMVSHRNLVANCAQFIAFVELDPEKPKAYDSVRMLGWMPMFYVIGQTQFTVIQPKRGMCNYLMDTVDLESLVRYIERLRITHVMITPGIVSAYTKTPALHGYDLSSIQMVASGGAPLGRKLCEQFEALLPNKNVHIKQGWGSTEITCSGMFWHPLDKTVSTSVGKLLPNCECKVISLYKGEPQELLGAGGIGELHIRAPNVVKGYWRKPAKTQATFTSDGWLKTGDVGYYDDRGYWYVLDRVSELIRVGEEIVVPSRLEDALLDIPAVADAAVVGIGADPAKQLYAQVVLDANQIPYSADGVAELFNAKVAAHEQLRSVFVAPAVPKLPGGKNWRGKVREQVVSMNAQTT